MAAIPRSMSARSAAQSTPTRASMRAWASEPRTSKGASRRSKRTEAVYCFTSSLTGSLKRPDQAFGERGSSCIERKKCSAVVDGRCRARLFWHKLCSAMPIRMGLSERDFGLKEAVKSINQNVHRDALPDFRNLGVILRIVLVVLAFLMLATLAEAGSWSDLGTRFLQLAAPVQPVLVLSILLLYAASEVLHKLSYRAGLAVVFLTEIIVVTIVHRV